MAGEVRVVLALFRTKTMSVEGQAGQPYLRLWLSQAGQAFFAAVRSAVTVLRVKSMACKQDGPDMAGQLYFVRRHVGRTDRTPPYRGVRSVRDVGLSEVL